MHTRSATLEAAAERNVPGGQKLLCTEGQASATWLCGVESAAALAKVPGLQLVQARSEVVLAAAEKYEPGQHVADCALHVMAGLSEAPEGTLSVEKKPEGHGVHTRSE